MNKCVNIKTTSTLIILLLIMLIAACAAFAQDNSDDLREQPFKVYLPFVRSVDQNDQPNTPVPLTVTSIPVSPTATNTAVPPTATLTNTPAPPTVTNTAVLLTATQTNTPVPPTATNTAVLATATNTQVSPTATSTPTLPTATVTATPTNTVTNTKNWPQWQKDEIHTGYSADATMLQPPLTVVWQAALGSQVWGQVVVDNVIYASTDNGKLHAIDAITGNHLWTYTSNKFHISSPSVSNGKVYALAGWGTSGDLAEVIVLDATNGQIQWKQLLTVGHGTDGSTPTISNGVVYVGGGDWALYAFDATTGKRLWRTSVNDGITASPSIIDGRIFAGTWRGNFYSLEASTGSILWSHQLGGALWSSSSVYNGIVYIGGGYANHYALNINNGQEIWRADTEDSGNCPVAVANNVVYIGALAGKLYAYDSLSGALRWSYQTGGQIAPSSGCPVPAVVGGIVYVTVRNGSLVALNSSNGGELATFQTDGTDFPSPAAIVNDTLIIGSSSGKLYALRGRATIYSLSSQEKEAKLSSGFP